MPSDGIGSFDGGSFVISDIAGKRAAEMADGSRGSQAWGQPAIVGDKQDLLSSAPSSATSGGVGSALLAALKTSSTSQAAPAIEAQPEVAAPKQPQQQPPLTQVVPSVQWFYRDPSGNVQGPFQSQEMNEWFHDNYFDASLPVRRGTDSSFILLGQILSISIEHQQFPFSTPFPAGFVVSQSATPLQPAPWGAFGSAPMTPQVPEPHWNPSFVDDSSHLLPPSLESEIHGLSLSANKSGLVQASPHLAELKARHASVLEHLQQIDGFLRMV
jgi:hypothetical protein